MASGQERAFYISEFHFKSLLLSSKHLKGSTKKIPLLEISFVKPAPLLGL
jgi:hypothetical protein